MTEFEIKHGLSQDEPGPLEPVEIAQQDDTLARTGNTARDQEMYAAGIRTGEENAKHNAAIRAGAPGASTVEEKPAAYLTLDEDGSPCMLFFDVVEARAYCEVGEEPEALWRRPASAAGDAQDALPPLNADLIEILGRPNFRCGGIAARLRADGQDIKRKSEHEQAATIHFLLGHYLKHGTNWRETAGSALDAIAAQRKGDA
ncbi:MAG: hypothetical protein ACN6PJ_27655 [Achromobacter sp.]|uniref:hypothetical protein n=1 Tax=Achromobacter sp. TaxID=134375 RepID=UPI003D04792B